MANLTYQTRDGETVDLICWRHYGSTTGRVVEAVLEANPGLADYGPVLPLGVLITLPELELAQQVRGVRLWD